MATMLWSEGTASAHYPPREVHTGPVPGERNPEPEVQPHHILPAGHVPAVQVFPELVLPDHGVESAHSRNTDWLSVHLLDTFGMNHLIVSGLV